MRPANKANWNNEVWQQYIEEAVETAKNLETLGAKDSAKYWKGVIIARDDECKRFVKPAIPYQE